MIPLMINQSYGTAFNINAIQPSYFLQLWLLPLMRRLFYEVTIRSADQPSNIFNAVAATSFNRIRTKGLSASVGLQARIIGGVDLVL